jgi:probable rRNA maturation factor
MISVSVAPAMRGRLSALHRKKLRSRIMRMVRAVGLQQKLRAPLEVSVRIIDDAEMRALNKRYRHLDRPTDVLAFAQREGALRHVHPHVLGDIVISFETAVRQAKRGVFAELLFLFAHGLCHLLGYDHQTAEQDAIMKHRVSLLLCESQRKGRVRAA